MQDFDFIVIGGGIFGSYAALYLSGKGYRVCLLEKETTLFRKASTVNQARLHAGYHYPRSVATARMSDDHRERFTAEHRRFIHFDFDKYYAIDRYSSLTDAAQFQRFCRHIGIRCEPVDAHPLFCFDRMEALFRTTEYSFDPYLLAAYYTARLEAEPLVQVRTCTYPTEASAATGRWHIRISSADRQEDLRSPVVINATYSASNHVNRIFGIPELALMHEISEIALLTSPTFARTGLTVMDGPYASMMPYGKSGLLSLSSVIYTHHQVSYDNLPTFECMQRTDGCRPGIPADCNTCPVRPRSHHHKMTAQIRQYIAPTVELQYLTSLFTVKSKLLANQIDDGRPTEIARLHHNPDFYCLFAGKINSIYEIEKMV
ncbi:MAG: hypothetical protein RLY31_3257 [Bacteroidota bacterium]|jgi:glycine/D-amino acid oxidase-like deaminating enzyme